MNRFLIFDSNENSVFYSIVKENPAISSMDSLSVENKESTPAINVGLNFQPPEDSLKYYVYVNRNKKQIKSKRTIFKKGVYHRCIVLEPTDIIEWSLIDESKIIMDYEAHKAETRFRGRSYTAWYAPDINIDAGPWKFNGLPGLILEVTDSENGVQFLLSSLEIPYETDEVLSPPSEDLVLTFEEYIELNNPERIASEFLGLINSKLPEGSKISSSPSVSFKKNVKGIERMY
jgi:GLPGLI family protein